MKNRPTRTEPPPLSARPAVTARSWESVRSARRDTARCRRHAAPVRLALLAIGLMLLLPLALLTLLTQHPRLADRMPRELASHLVVRASDKAGPIRESIGWVAEQLTSLDRGSNHVQPRPELSWSGARADHELDLRQARRVVQVDSTAVLADAMARAEPGTFIVLMPGRYRLEQSLRTPRAATPIAPVVVAAVRWGSAVIEVDTLIGIEVVHAHWIFENLIFKGVCNSDSRCEHALHIKGSAHRTIVRNNRFEDFNAPLKINREGDAQPDGGEVLHNTLINRHARRTERPVTGVDLVAGSRWRLHRNHVADFISADPARTTYALFAKGGAEDTSIEGNTIVCEQRLRGHHGHRVGLSLGGGGTAHENCRDGRGCVHHEHLGGLIRNNLVVGCSDAGIDLHRADRAVVAHNTLVDTAGIQGRHAHTRAFLWANWVDAPVRESTGAQLLGDSQGVQHAAWQAYLGLRRAPNSFIDPGHLDFRWRHTAPWIESGAATPRDDLCGNPRSPQRTVIGAFEDWAACSSSRSSPRSPGSG